METKEIAKAPDKKKLLVFAEQIKAVELPEVLTLEGQVILNSVEVLLSKISVFVEEQTGKM